MYTVSYEIRQSCKSSSPMTSQVNILQAARACSFVKHQPNNVQRSWRFLYPYTTSSLSRPQDLPKRKIKHRLAHVDLDIESGDGVCAAYCLTNPISLSRVANFFIHFKFEAEKHQEKIIFQSNDLQVFSTDVVHVPFQATEPSKHHSGHAFFFASGAAVFWGLPLHLRRELFSQLSNFQERTSQTPYVGVRIEGAKHGIPLAMHHFDHEFKYTVNEKRKQPTFKNDEIHLNDFSNVQQLLAFSYGLAQSTKLLLFEEVVDALVLRTRNLPDELARDGNIKLSHKELKRLIGELLAARYSVNLVSDIMDTPEYFWQHAELETLHLECAGEVELRQRARILDARTQVIKDALYILNNELSSSSSVRVERAILFLIAVEVFLELARVVPPFF